MAVYNCKRILTDGMSILFTCIHEQSKAKLRLNILLIVLVFMFLQAACTTALPETQSNVGPQAGLYESDWPHGRSGSWRTGARSGVGLPEQIDSDGLVAQSVQLPTTPLWGVIQSDEAIFILGGEPLLLKNFSYATAEDSQVASSSQMKQEIAKEAAAAAAVQPFVAKIDPRTMTVTKIVEFPRGSTLNYESSMLIHENGNIYAIGSAVLYEINPETMEITRSVALPTYDSDTAGTIYNGLVAAPATGDIITKSTNFIDPSLPAVLVAVDTSDLTVRFQTEVPIGAARIALIVQGDTEYVYAADNYNTQRFAIGQSGFEVDEAWSKPYRTDGDGTQAAVSMVYMKDQEVVLFANNNTVIFGVTAPLQIFVQSITDNDATIFSTNASSVTTAGGSFFGPSADPYNTQMVAANDQINGVIAGWHMQDDGTLEKVWESADYKSTGGMAIGSDQEHLYLDDRRCDESGTNCEIYLVVLNITTGDKIAEAKAAGSGATIGQIFLGQDSAYLIASEPGEENGYVTKVSLK